MRAFGQTKRFPDLIDPFCDYFFRNWKVEACLALTVGDCDQLPAGI